MSQLVSYIQQARQIVGPGFQITTAESWGIWAGKDARYPDLAQLTQAVDYLFVNIHPYWEQVCVDQATADVFAELSSVTGKNPGVRVKLSETGWPSDGETQGCATPTANAQQQFVRTFYCEAQKSAVDFYLFEATDEQWKSLPYPGQPSPPLVESHWGLYDSKRDPKPAGAPFACP